MWQDLWVALALLLVIEGVMPFLSPEALRRALLLISQMNDNALRFTGLTSMVLGVVLLYLIH
ncbi:MAG: DUF2065 domain-containing protein [Gammaproteobacteria bacterium]|jgi:uncharacterized protein YjeT (DUF2065 family)